MTNAIAYFRTSSLANVGGDSQDRQNKAVQRFAGANGFKIVRTFYDAGVSGTDAIEERPGFVQLLDEIELTGVTTVIAEDASRIARDLMIQEQAIAMLIARGVTVLDATGNNLTDASCAMRVMVRQILGAVVQAEKTRVVQKLAGARARIRASGEKCDGRKSFAEINPEARALAKRLHRRSPKTGKRRSLRQIADLLEKEGFATSRGNPLSASMIARLINA